VTDLLSRIPSHTQWLSLIKNFAYSDNLLQKQLSNLRFSDLEKIVCDKPEQEKFTTKLLFASLRLTIGEIPFDIIEGLITRISYLRKNDFSEIHVTPQINELLLQFLTELARKIDTDEKINRLSFALEPLINTIILQKTNSSIILNIDISFLFALTQNKPFLVRL